MCEKHLDQCFVLTALHRTDYPATRLSSQSVFQALIFFYDVLGKNISNCFFAQYQKCSNYFSSFTGW